MSPVAGGLATFAGLPRPQLSTDRLRLDQPARQDIPAIVAGAGDVEVSRWLARVPHPYRPEDADLLLDVVVRDSLVLALRRRADGVFLGLMSLHADGEVELGYWLARPYWGAGYATEAGRAVLGHAFGPLGLARVRSGVFEGNAASARVLGKLGFVEVGRSMKESVSLGRAVPHIDMVCERPADPARG